MAEVSEVREQVVQIEQRVQVLDPTCLLCSAPIEHAHVEAAAKGWRPGVRAVAWKAGYAHLGCASSAWRHAVDAPSRLP